VKLLEKFCIVLLILYVINFPKVIGKITGLVLYVEFFFWVVPTLIIIIYGFINKKLKLPYLILFTILAIWFIVNESTLFRNNILANYDYIIGLLKFYSIFVVFLTVGYDRNRYKEILIYCTIIITPFILLFYLSYLGFITLQFEGSVVGFNYEYQRFTSGTIMNPNAISYVAAFGIIVAQLLRFEFGEKKFYWAIIIFNVGIILLHASRGAFLISLVVLILFWFNEKKRTQSLSFVTMFAFSLTILLLTYFFLGLIEDLYIYYRFFETRYTNIGRVQQIYSSFENFLDAPFWGKGYTNAGYSIYYNTARSNFHYTQVLATTGIIWSTFYFYFLYRIFVGNGNVKYKLIFILIGILTFAFYNWTEIVAVSVIVYFSHISPYMSKLRK